MKLLSLSVLFFQFFSLVTFAKIDDSSVTSELSAYLQPVAAPFVLVQVWSPFCSSCGFEVSKLNALAKTVTNDQLHILGIPIQGRKQEIDAFVENFKPQFLQWSPGQDFIKKISTVGAVPLTFVLNQRRKIIAHWVGPLPISELKEILTNHQSPR